MGEETFNRQLLWKVLPRIFNAVIGGLLVGSPILLIYNLPGYAERLEMFFPDGGSYFSGLMTMYILFEVVIRLLSGTVVVYVLGIARALITMIILVYTSNGGILSRSILFGPIAIKMIIEFRPILAMSLLLSLLIVCKNLMRAIGFLAEKSEKPIVPQELP